MKVIISVVVLVCLSAASYAYPSAAKPDVKDEVEIVPLQPQPFGDHAIVDTGVFVGPGSSFSPFDGLFGNVADVFTRMRQQMETLLRRIHGSPNNSNSTDVGIGSLFPEVDLSKGNTTSVTKMIDGHKVVINETEYKQEGELGGSFFKVRIIDVHPSDDNTEGTPKDVEEVTTKSGKQQPESGENEIAKYSNAASEALSFQNIESFEETDGTTFHHTSSSGKPFGVSAEWSSLEPLESFEGNSLDSVPPRTVVDLSRDTLVNKLLADSGAPTNPDAEIFSSVESTWPYVAGSSSRSPNKMFERMIDPR